MQTEFRGSRWVHRWLDACAMGFWPLVWRAGYEARKRLGLMSRHRGVDPDSAEEVLALFEPAFASEADLLAHFRRGGRGAFYLRGDEREATASAIESLGADESVVAAAEAVCARRFELMARTFDFAAGEIDWHFDPDTGQSWPRERWDRIDIRTDGRLGDVKFTWELNRHQFWPLLGRAYWLTGDERYPHEWVDQFRSWAQQNPPEIGVNWLSNLEHALRIVSWWTTARLMMHSPAMTGGVLRRLIGLLACKARHIVADLEYSRINMANNHLIGDAMGLTALGWALPELREARGWAQRGLSILTRHLPRQVRGDGSSIECSASYHRFVLQFLVLLLAQRRASGRPWPDDTVPDSALRLAEFLGAVIRPNGTVPAFGDFDSGLAYRLNEAPVTDFRPVLSTAAVLLERGDLKRAAGHLDAETVWLLGPQAVDEFRHLDDRRARPRRRLFADGGYLVDRAGRDDVHLFFQAGRFTSHTHADLLSFCLHADDRDVLIDSGTFTYNGDWRWRTYFRSTRAHNTVTVGGEGQALAHRAFRWVGRPRARWRAVADEGRFLVDAEHDGYRRLGVRHRRVLIALAARTWLCLDILDGTGRQRFAVHWHLAEDLAATIAADATVLARRGERAVLSLSAAGTTDVTPRCARGQEIGQYFAAPDELRPAGWRSREYGLKQPAEEITFSAAAALPQAVATVVHLGEERWRPEAVTLEPRAVHVRLRDVSQGAALPGAARTGAAPAEAARADITSLGSITYHLRPAGGRRGGRLRRVGMIRLPGEDRGAPLNARCLRTR